MRTRIFLILAVLAAAISLGPWLVSTSLADGPTDGAEQTVLRALPSGSQAPGQQSITFTAKLESRQDQPVGGAPVTFYVLTDVFGERLMKVGEVLTDTTGTASLVYKPTWVGDHTVVVRFDGDNAHASAQSSFQFSATGPVPVHEDPAFGLAPLRQWLPFAMGAVVLALWAVLGLVVVRTVVGIPAAASTVEPLTTPATQPLRSPVFSRAALAMVSVLILIALPLTYLLLQKGGGESVSLTTESAYSINKGEQLVTEPPSEETLPTWEIALPATLVRSVPVTTSAGGQLTTASADMPADIAAIGKRELVLDTNNGRILVVTADGKLAPVLETERTGDTSLRGAMAMTVHGGKLYVANSLAGNVMVVTSSGQIERVIKPRVPTGEEPLRPAGIVVTAQGEIWLSDSANHRVLLLNEQGELLNMIGKGAQSSGEEGFNTPGGLTLDQQGNLYVVDTLNRQVKKYSPQGAFLTAIGKDRLDQPKAVAVDASGKTFVSDDKSATVKVFGPDGSYLGSVGKEDPADKESSSWLQVPHGLKVQDNLLYVMDRLAGLFIFQVGGG